MPQMAPLTWMGLFFLFLLLIYFLAAYLFFLSTTKTGNDTTLWEPLPKFHWKW
uniref:ATP synthase F0 subunit 8 n=1 Tax=Pseudoniphargus daviui TaxID=1041814 RepID=K7ZTS2_9CRUS|nr:ATP synthase F0 subunit 8 [Pseudoniphargus daviui]CCB84631.2 ATP synthase F0 subunit 8 [Pseudoniphargus daviui]